MDQKTLQTATPAKTPGQRGWRWLAQSAIGAVIGLFLAVWEVPGVPETINEYAQTNFLPLFITLLVLVGIPTAVVTFVQNYLETRRKAN